jgi:hypothetical protein
MTKFHIDTVDPLEGLGIATLEKRESELLVQWTLGRLGQGRRKGFVNNCALIIFKDRNLIWNICPKVKTLQAGIIKTWELTDIQFEF